MAVKKSLLMSVILLSLAVFLVGCGDDAVTRTVITEDEAPMLPPQILKAARTDGGITIQWSPNTQNHLLGYNVYRAPVTGNVYTKLNSAVIVGTTYVDGNVPDGQYFKYQVTAVSTGLSESPSTSVTVFNGSENGQDKKPIKVRVK